MASRSHAPSDRFRNAAATLLDANQSVLTDIRRAVNIMKDVAVDMEKDKESQKVNVLENAAMELLQAFEDCSHLSSAVQSVTNSYQPREQLTDFKKLFEEEISKMKTNSSSDAQNNPLLRQFREAVWNVHHSGQPMPGEEQEDLVMTSTQCNILNITCPLSGKPVTELNEPVRSTKCRHIYEKAAIMHHIQSKRTDNRCPVAGCPQVLRVETVICDPLLPIEIEELRTMSKQNARRNVLEDFTMLGDDEDEDGGSG